MAAVMSVIAGQRPLGWIRAEALATISMVGGNLGVALISTAIAMSDPLPLPFVGLPVLKLVYSYKQIQRQARERERANALVELSSALTASGGPAEVIEGLLPALRKLFVSAVLVLTVVVAIPAPAPFPHTPPTTSKFPNLFPPRGCS